MRCTCSVRGVLEQSFADRLVPLAGFRNILVHDYAKIDYTKVAEVVNDRLGDFETFAQSRRLTPHVGWGT